MEVCRITCTSSAHPPTPTLKATAPFTKGSADALGHAIDGCRDETAEVFSTPLLHGGYTYSSGYGRVRFANSLRTLNSKILKFTIDTNITDWLCNLSMRHAPSEADVFFAISDRTRRALLRRLADGGEQPVTELVRPFSISQPAISKHLRCLRGAGLVRRRSQGRRRFYRLEADRLRQVFDWVAYFEKYWDQKLDALGDYLDKRKRTKQTPA